VVLESNTTDIGAIHGVDVRHLQRVQSILADNRLSIGIARDKHSAVFGVRSNVRLDSSRVVVEHANHEASRNGSAGSAVREIFNTWADVAW